MVGQASTSLRIRALQPGEADLHRAVRLRALLDSPHSFGGTFADEDSKPPDYWDAQARALTEPGHNVMFLAGDGSNIVGMVYGLRHRDRADESRVGGMWVDPSARRCSIGGQLLNAVIDWARERQSRRIGLWAPVDSPAAIAFYRRMGFAETANRARLRVGSDREIVEMTIALGASRSLRIK